MSNFRAGDLVEVRSAEEILRTLDADGRLDALPFMPEMLQFCGQRLRVQAVAHKACDTIVRSENRRMPDAVHLETRCDGSAHDGCQAGCLLYWKQAWLKRVDEPATRGGSASAPGTGGCTRETLQRGTRVEVPDASGAPPAIRYICQATEMHRATLPMRWWHPWQYWRDFTSGNVPLGRLVKYLVISWLNAYRRRRGLPEKPPFPRGSQEKTPHTQTGLQAGEKVRIKPAAEIVETLDRKCRNRGLLFDREMALYCGETHTVLRRVEKFIDDRSGKMVAMPRDAILLDGVVCQGVVSRERMFCPRAIYPFWREMWLERVEDDK